MIPVNSEMRFETTTHCNYDCIICKRNGVARELRTMTQNDFCKIFDKITGATDQYTALSFAGTGDPLCDLGLEDKIRYAKSKYPDLFVPIVTNGSLLTLERFRRLRDAGVDTIRISFHGGTPEAYFKVHRRDGFNLVYRNVMHALDTNSSVDITVTMVVVPENEGTVLYWLELWKDRRIALKEIWRAHNWVGYHKYRVIQKEKIPTCGRVFNGPLQVQVDGTVNMCCMDFDGELLLGDLNTQTLHEIFRSEMYEKLVKCHMNGNFKGSNLMCEECEQRNKNKMEACVYSSRFMDREDRVKRVSTTHERVL